MNVDIFALYMSNIRENMYIVKITLMMPDKGDNIKNANINPREIANFSEMRENLYTRKYISSQ